MYSPFIYSVGSLTPSTYSSSLKLMKPHEYPLHNLTSFRPRWRRAGRTICRYDKEVICQRPGSLRSWHTWLGTSGEYCLFRDPQERTTGLQLSWRDCPPTRMGLWTHLKKGLWVIDLLDKGKVSWLLRQKWGEVVQKKEAKRWVMWWSKQWAKKGRL